MTEVKQPIRWGRLAFYLVIIPITLVYIYYSFPVTYTHYRYEFLAQMNRVYERDRQKKTNVAMSELSDLALPPMPAGGS